MIASSSAWGNVAGTGSTGPFNVPFALYSQSHLTLLSVTNNIPTQLNLGTDYSFSSWSPDTKGQVENPQITTTNPVAGGTTLIFLLAVPGLQNTAVTNFPAFFPSLHEAEFDQLQQQINELSERVNKSIKAPDQEHSTNGVNLTLAPIAQRASTVLAMDANGNLVFLPQNTTVGIPFLGVVANQAVLPATTVFAMAVTLDSGQLWYWNPLAMIWQALV